MIATERLHNQLRALGLEHSEEVLDARLEEASRASLSYADFLADLLQVELDRRRERYMQARTRLAHLPFRKTLEQFDFAFQPSVDERLVRQLEQLTFVTEATNIILLGPPGVGKTHLAVALGLEAISKGYGVYFVTAHKVVDDLKQAYTDGRLERRMRVYVAPKVLIVDEMGYLPYDRLEATLFFQLISSRYERGSIILTSNKSFGEWGEVFGDSVLAAAILDRLLHHSHILNIRGESYRLREKRRAGLFGAPPPSGEGDRT